MTQEIQEFRDMQAASEVARRAALGWFDVEFNMFGSAYLAHGKRYYQISADAEKIYDEIDAGLQEGFLPTNVITAMEKVPVPVGMQEHIALEVKKELSRSMQEHYPVAFFVYLENLSKQVEENTAFLYLDEMREGLESCFDAKKLENYEHLVEYMFLRRKIDRKNYQYFKNWLIEERKYMDIVIIQKGRNKKQFYGLGYQTSPQNPVQYISNAKKDVVYAKKYELERKGAVVTPIFTDIYEQRQNVCIPQIRKQFERDLQNYINQSYMQSLWGICTKNSCISKEDFLKYLDDVEKQFGQYAKETLEQYGYRWGILYK